MSAAGSHALGLHLTQAGLSTGRRPEEGGKGKEKKEGKKRNRDREITGGVQQRVQLPACLPAVCVPGMEGGLTS